MGAAAPSSTVRRPLEIREAMKEADVERLVERAQELHPGVSPRILSDNGPQLIAGDLKQYIRLTGMTYVRTSPYYPQSKASRPAADRALAQDPQGRRYPPEDARHPRRGRSCRRHQGQARQPQTPPLRHRDRHPRRPPRRTPQGHQRGARHQARIRPPSKPERPLVNRSTRVLRVKSNRRPAESLVHAGPVQRSHG